MGCALDKGQRNWPFGTIKRLSYLKRTFIYLFVYYLFIVYRLFVGKPEGKRPLGSPRRRWIDNIKMGLLEIGLNVVDWIGLAQDRHRWRALVNSVMYLQVP
jgi:hypothetical protein